MLENAGRCISEAEDCIKRAREAVGHVEGVSDLIWKRIEIEVRASWVKIWNDGYDYGLQAVKAETAQFLRDKADEYEKKDS